MRKTILFVCTGNICRSPMAESIFNEFIAKRPSMNKLFDCTSAGLMAQEGFPMSMNASKALGNMGVASREHRSKLITQALIDESYLVLTMEKRHADKLRTRFDGVDKKAYTLLGYALGEADNELAHGIADPFMMGIDVYDRTAEQICAGIKALIERLSREKKD